VIVLKIIFITLFSLLLMLIIMLVPLLSPKLISQAGLVKCSTRQVAAVA
jgi:hypothetical protein